MPDLTIEIRQQCTSGESAITHVGGYEQRFLMSENLWPECTCPAYKYGHRVINFGGRMVPELCKHLKEAKQSLCDWHEAYSDEVQTVQGVCPKCGSATVAVMVGV